jgi:hypothetical protein
MKKTCPFQWTPRGISDNVSVDKELDMGELADLVPLSKLVLRELLDDMNTRDNVKADVAKRVLESEGHMRGPKTDTGKMFVLNMKSDDVVGALKGMQTVFGEIEDEVKEPVKEIRRVNQVEGKAKSEKRPRAEPEGALRDKIIKAEKGF